mgnify:CR=1 FL=1
MFVFMMLAEMQPQSARVAWSGALVSVTQSHGELDVVIGVGLLVVLVAVPALIVLVGLAWLFWGVFPGALATAMFLLGVLGVLWFISPAFTGLWLGRRLFAGPESDLLKLVLGVLVVVLAIRIVEWIPVAGGLLA